ncbi:MAG: hypothetical protein DWQ08_02650 [Proteobacteria bacterium]|nr:MAG: hypothetical protein DWQ08_02650 [Pseudomonadota bacterium]
MPDPGFLFLSIPQMNQLLSYFVNVCLFRSGPQDAPASEALLIATGFLVALSYTLTNGMYPSLYDRIVIAVSQVLVFGAVVWVVLKIKNLESRWVQTLTALYGSAALFQFLSWPFIEMFDGTGGESADLPQPLWLHVAVGAWYLAVMSNILRHALETSLGRGVAAAIFCQLSTVFGLVLILSLFGVGDASV